MLHFSANPPPKSYKSQLKPKTYFHSSSIRLENLYGTFCFFQKSLVSIKRLAILSMGQIVHQFKYVTWSQRIGYLITMQISSQRFDCLEETDNHLVYKLNVYVARRQIKLVRGENHHILFPNSFDKMIASEPS